MKRISVASLALFTIASVSASAHAAQRPPTGKIRTGTETTTVGAAQGTIGSATASCPPGSRAVSGGFSTAPTPNELAVVSSKRSGRRAWTASVVQVTNMGVTSELTTYVYCDRRLRRASAVSVPLSVPVSTSETASPTCPAGRRAISGGFELDPSSGAGLVMASARTKPRKWSTTVHSVNGPTTELTAYAYCRRRPGRLRTREGTATLPGYPPSGTATAISARCPERIGARSGGFEITEVAPTNLYAVFESRRAGRRWRFSVRNFGVPMATPLAALAYCS